MPHIGIIDVIAGPMFSGKSAELIRRLGIHNIADKKMNVYKHSSDTRFGKPRDVSSRNGTSIMCLPIANSQEIINHFDPTGIDLLAIDEIQFFDAVPLVMWCKDLADSYPLKIIVCGLDMDFRGVPFETTAQFMAIADHIYKTRAVCMRCKNTDGIYTHKLHGSDDRFEVGSDNYEPRCRQCVTKIKEKN